MRKRDANLMHVKDLLEHLMDCARQLEWAQNADAARLVTETMLRDLEICRSLCESLRQGNAFRPAV